jgi:peptide-methionine (S)-S-oxide reductase
MSAPRIAGFVSVLAAAVVALALGAFGVQPGAGQPLMSRADTLPGRAAPIATARAHHVFHTPLAGPFPRGSEVAYFGMGCFWGVEKAFWTIPGVVSTAAGYAGGATPNPTYEEVVTGRTGHAEVVRVVFDPSKLSYEELLRVFWEGHDPTQGMRQGADHGTQYRSLLLTTTPAQARLARASMRAYQRALREHGLGTITTQIEEAGPFYFAEAYHQQYLSKNPAGYCGHGGTGVSCPTGAF